MKCISIPECTQRSSHLFIGGQHGQESYEEGSQEDRQEGCEERSEEDRQEDQEGCEEEVTSSSSDRCRRQRRQRHEGLAAVCFSKRMSNEALVDEEGVGETSGHTAGRHAKESSLSSQAGLAKKPVIR